MLYDYVQSRGGVREECGWSRFPFSYSVLDPETGCWLWQRGKDRNGYPQVVIGGRHLLAHRWAYERLVVAHP